MLNIKAPINSTTNVNFTIYLAKFTTPPCWLMFKASLITLLSLRVILFLTATNIIVTILIKPNPPIWIRAKIIHWPIVDQCSAVGKTARPVIHTAEVDVKKASIKPVHWPEADDKGNISKKAPINIVIKKPNIIIWVSFNLLKKIFIS